jgi:hypothetical protein
MKDFTTMFPIKLFTGWYILCTLKQATSLTATANKVGDYRLVLTSDCFFVLFNQHYC